MYLTLDTPFDSDLYLVSLLVLIFDMFLLQLGISGSNLEPTKRCRPIDLRHSHGIKIGLTKISEFVLVSRYFLKTL
jgi:hypothetical protein